MTDENRNYTNKEIVDLDGEMCDSGSTLPCVRLIS